MIRRLRFRLEAAGFGLLLLMAQRLPRRPLLALGSALGRLGYLLDRRHRRIALNNVRHAYGDEIDEGAARRIVRDCFRHFGRTTLDTLAFSRFNRDNLEQRVEFVGLEHIRAAYAKGNGVLLFSGHYGHWELIALLQGFLDLPLVLVTRPLDNADLERMLARLRGASGNRVLHKRDAAKEMIRALRSGSGVAIVIDQDAREDGVFVPFFGHPSSTTSTLARLALRSGAAIVPAFSIPRPDGTYRIVYEPEIAIHAGDDREADVLRITAECTAIIERWVRRHPQLWLWMHRRWKTTTQSG